MGHGIHPRDGHIVRKALGSPPMMVRLWMWRSLQTLALIEPLTDCRYRAVSVRRFEDVPKPFFSAGTGYGYVKSDP